MSDVYLVGIGMTPFGKFPELSVKDLTRTAVEDALSDAACERRDIAAAWFANTSQGALEGQFSIPGEIALRSMGFEGLSITNVENACASASTAFHLAYTHLRAGMSEVALAVGCEKLYTTDMKKTEQAFAGALDVHNTESTIAEILTLGEGVEPPGGVRDDGSFRTVFMDIYAALARFHMKTFGTTQRQMAEVSAKNHFHSTMNPLAQYQKTMTAQEVLEARVVSWPLTLPMCSPISDGAAAAVLCRGEALDRFDSSRAIKVLASVVGTSVNRAAGEVDKHVSRLAALNAYNQAGLGPEDMSLAEVHDATAFAEIQQSENLGFCAFGQGGWVAERGETRLGSRIPINVSGGLESKGHPIGATGLGQICELTVQLRGEAGKRQVKDARFGIAENGGGFYRFEEAVVGITILGRSDL